MILQSRTKIDVLSYTFGNIIIISHYKFDTSIREIIKHIAINAETKQLYNIVDFDIGLHLFYKPLSLFLLSLIFLKKLGITNEYLTYNLMLY